MMNYEDIERLKELILSRARQGCRFTVPAWGVEGRVVGTGFKPYWTSPVDSKIEKLELNVMDNHGTVASFSFLNIVGYEIASSGGKRPDDTGSIGLDIHVYSPKKAREREPYDKVHIEIGSLA